MKTLIFMLFSPILPFPSPRQLKSLLWKEKKKFYKVVYNLNCIKTLEFLLQVNMSYKYILPHFPVDLMRNYNGAALKTDLLKHFISILLLNIWKLNFPSGYVILQKAFLEWIYFSWMAPAIPGNLLAPCFLTLPEKIAGQITI